MDFCFVDEIQTLAEKLKSALEEYDSYNGKSLNSVIFYMKNAQKYLTANKNSENSHKKLEKLVLECKRKIIENNFGLIRHIVRRYCPEKNSYYDDFISEAVIGLLNAIPGYKPEIGKFSDYAGSAIRNNIERRMQRILGNIKLPIAFLSYQKEIEYFIEFFKNKYKRAPTNKEIADLTKNSVRRIREIRGMKNLYNTASLDAKISSHERDVGCLLDCIDAYRDCSLEEKNIKKIIYQELISCINELPDKKQVRILLGRLEGKTFEQIALEMNRTRARIEQIEKRAIAKVKKMERYQRLLA